MSYYDIVFELLKKYGPVEKDFFKNENCEEINKTGMYFKYGLYRHHILEYRFPTQCMSAKWSKLKFKWCNKKFYYEISKANNLVYCNSKEHLLLHYLIWKEKQPDINRCGIISTIANYVIDYPYDYDIAGFVELLPKDIINKGIELSEIYKSKNRNGDSYVKRKTEWNVKS